MATGPLHSWTLALIVVGALAALFGGLLFVAVGWLGLGLLGLFGLLVSVRLDLHGGTAAGIASNIAMKHHAQHLEDRLHAAPEQKAAEAARRSERERALYIINTICLALVGLGFSMFVLHQL